MPLKIVFIYRKPCNNAYSIEILLQTIAKELREHVEIIEYETGPRWKVLQDILTLRRMHVDVYHVTGDVNYFVPFLDRSKTVLTIHDIGHYLYGLKGLKRFIYKWVWLDLPIIFSRYVTVVSKKTLADIRDYLGFSTRRIEVIDNCYNPIFVHKEKFFNKDCPTILQVGTKPNKNVPRLLDALHGLKCCLVLIGRLNDDLKQQLNEYKIHYKNYVNISNEKIYQNYMECDIVSFVSLGEGFGVPILEAQAAGRPLVTSNLPPMSDVAGREACLVDPYDITQIRTAFFRIIEDDEYRQKLIKNGLRNSKKYSPKHVSQCYFKLYKRIATK